MKSLPRLSPTSYALLGLLARNPHSAYELNRVMQTSLLRAYWPRAESHVYSEPKKLLAHGFVSEHRETTNGRNRSVYTVTDQGRHALTCWLREGEQAQLRTQAEFMLKLILADGGSTAEARTTLERATAATQSDLERAIAGVEHLLDSPADGELGHPWNGIATNLMADILVARYNWGQYAQQAIENVSDDSTSDEKVTLGREAYANALATMKAALNK